ncbi:MAG: CAP domain-containing protein [Phycisphaeraceae bacterium]|nr:CAP domain-containing protein [Phycisphaeraceae bacterium]
MVALRTLPLMLLIASFFVPAVRADDQAPELTRAELNNLRRQAMGPDSDAALKAMDALAKAGPDGQDALRSAARSWVNRTEQSIQRELARAGEPKWFLDRQAAFDQVRSEALANIRVLERDDNVRKAREFQESLKTHFEALQPFYHRRALIIEAFALRARFLEYWEEVRPENEPIFTPERIERLTQRVEQVLGMDAEKAAIARDWVGGRTPEEPMVKTMAFYFAARRIHEFNQHQRTLVDDAEWENIQKVNEYRIHLGLLPFEVDPRLVQAARRHSKEMAEMGYFSHTSPTPENRSHVQRMRNAGYPRGTSENIAMGTISGERAFRMWFDSPGHHKIMASTGNSGFGVGRWGRHWTQKFGRGPRIMLMSESEQAQVTIEGDILPPMRGR